MKVNVMAGVKLFVLIFIHVSAMTGTGVAKPTTEIISRKNATHIGNF
jgi:hypothetical protein